LWSHENLVIGSNANGVPENLGHPVAGSHWPVSLNRSVVGGPRMELRWLPVMLYLLV
jgi:hypothetical protein